MTPMLALDAPNPRTYLRNAPVLERLMFRTSETPDGCWLWRGTLNHHGYGVIGLGGDKGRTAKVHRVAFEELVGPIAADLTIDHLCRNRACVNPDHLEPVPLRVNQARGWEARRAAGVCWKGLHEMTPENVAGHGKYRCLACGRESARARRARVMERV
jgi:hypothetical protein